MINFKSLQWQKEPDGGITAHPENLNWSCYIRKSVNGAKLLVFNGNFEQVKFSQEVKSIGEAKLVALEHYQTILKKFIALPQ